MCPFIDDDNNINDDFEEAGEERTNFLDNVKEHFLKDDKKFFIIGVSVSVFVFIIVMFMMYTSSRPAKLEDLPVIKATNEPIKMRPEANEKVQHQDKTVYDNISGESREEVEEKVIALPEEVISIPEADVKESELSSDERKQIIEEFDKLAPQSEYKINYVDKNGKIKRTSDKRKGNLKSIVDIANEHDEEERTKSTQHNNEKIQPSADDINKVKKDIPVVSKEVPAKKEKKHNAEKKIDKKLNNTDALHKNKTIMIQVSSLSSRSDADIEYQRILRKNPYLKNVGKKIVKVDLGPKKGVRHRVLIGPFSGKNDVKKIISSLKNNGISAYIAK